MRKNIFFIISCLVALIIPTSAQVHLLQDADGWRVVADADPTLVLAYGTGTPPRPETLAGLSEASPNSQRQSVKQKVTYSNVSPLITSHWAQDAPFNELCPEHPGSGGRLCKTGCVATAMAQILHYHRKPLSASGYKTYGLTISGKRLNLSCHFASLSFAWDKMLNTYTSSSSAAERHAVAELMYACGVAASMQYTYSYSGADPAVAADGINSFFDGVKAQFTSYSAETVMSELRSGRPVMYSGANSVEAHCFVIDGANTQGYFHCNLGHGGDGDGYYLPTNVGGYPTAQSIVCVSPTSGRTNCTPMAELRGKYAAASQVPATAIEANRWYVLWNSGRGGSPYSSGTGKTVMNTGNIPSAYGEATSENAGQLIRFVPSGSGYYIQTGLGDYLGSFAPNGGTGVTTSGRSQLFTTGTIRSGYFWLRSGSAYIDTNGIAKTVVGWSTTAPSDTLSNSAWRLYPVTITDAAVPVRVNDNLPLTLRNTGYSQGYLVATSASDAHPTLRGVTQDHSNGLYSGAQYHTPADLASEGARWHLITREGKQYLYNRLTRKYLTNTGNQTCYVFTSTPAPINCQRSTQDSKLLTFNSGADAQSYLCAATHMANPAAYWTASDAGSVWLVEEAVDYTPVQSLSLSDSHLSMMRGQQHTLVATVLPANASSYQLDWSSSDSGVVSVDASGVVTAVDEGTAVISVSPRGNASVRATCMVSVGGASQVTGGKLSLTPYALYVLRNQASHGGYLVAAAANSYSVTLRGVSPSVSCYSSSYQQAADLTSALSQWQIEKLSYDSQRDIYLATVRNVATGLYLADTGKGTPYVLTSSPAEITVLGSGSDFCFRCSALNYLTANPTSGTPASYSTSGGAASNWSLFQVGETIPTGLPAISQPLMSHPSSPAYDLRGLPATQRGIVIQQGEKKIRK